ncbi:zinc finger, PHD-type containing protein [Tanacetum coccineum]
MTALLNDLSYIPLNNEQNEPTQGDIGKTSNEPTQDKRNEFEELYASANEELYPICDYVTRLDFMAKFTYFKVKGKLTGSIFNEMLEFFQNVFPTSKGYKLPPSYYAIKKTIACVNDCFLFRGDKNKDVHFCPVCKTSRWKDSNTPWKKVPKKVLRYFLIIPRLQRLYKSSHTAKEMNWHVTGKLQSPLRCNTRLMVEHRRTLTPSLQHAAGYIDNIQSASVVMYEREFFYADLALKGVKTIDVATGRVGMVTRHALHVMKTLLLCVCVLGKTAYVGHRRFLKKTHKWRRSLKFNGETEDGDPPRTFNRDQIYAEIARLPTRVKGKHPSYEGVKIKHNVLVELNWTKRSIFYELEYWSFLTLKHNLDIIHIGKNMLESILNTLLMNDKSKDTTKARQDLKRFGIRSRLWLGQNKNGKYSKHQAAYSFTTENRKKFCLKSHDCHIMMQRLLPYGLQQYLPDEVVKPIIKLCSFFKQICSQTLMEDDMLKAQSKVIDILCNLELIYPPAFFDIMIHLVIHLPLEALEGGPIHPWWMFPFERFMKKLKGYVRNKAKPEGSITEGYVAEEALTFSSHYFRDVTTKFNHPNRNVDPPPPTYQFQVFRSVCKSIGLWSVIRFADQELKKMIWYVLHNSPEIDTYRSKFKSEFPNKDMKEEFPGWFESQIRQRHVDNNPGVSTSSELFALASGPTPNPISLNSCVVNGVRFVMHSRDERRTTQNNGICSPGGKDGEMYYG